MQESEESNGLKEPKLRLNVKRNFKGEKGYEFTVRGDTIEEIEKLKEQIKKIAEMEMV